MSSSKYSRGAVSLLVLLPVLLTGQRAQENVVPLKNWATPLYWQPNQAESRAGSQGAVPQLQFSANAVSANALTFIAITPCRLVDTRGAAAGFNGADPFAGPSIASKATLTIPVQSPTEATTNTTPAPCGVIPSIAQAYSFNLTVVPVAAGAVDYVSMWPAGSTQPVVATLDDPQGAIVSNAAIVPAGPSASPGYGGVSVYNDGPATTNVIIDMNGYFAAPSDLDYNTAIGVGTLASNTTGNANTAVGAYALTSNTTGFSNTSDGSYALAQNTTGCCNTAMGESALNGNTTGGSNTAIGTNALEFNTTGGGNTATGGAALQNNTTGSNNTAGGLNALQLNTTGSYNTAAGVSALQANTTGNFNTASGQSALSANTAGGNNTASGVFALLDNTTGNQNTAAGGNALQHNTTGGNNTATGQVAMQFNTTGSNNTASGQVALLENTSGDNNTASGVGALQNSTTGSNNAAFGYQAALNVSTGSNNIHIGNLGVSSDGAAVNSGVIRIGTSGTQTSFFAAGISGATTGLGGAVPVVIDANGQLGTISSSQRFKEDIQDMGEASSGLMRLRPVTFRYKQPYEDGSKPVDYGLIAEEVAQVYPDLAVRGADGQIQTVQYQKLTPMLLNELQKQRETIRLQNERIEQQEARLAAVEALLSDKTPSSADSDH